MNTDAQPRRTSWTAAELMAAEFPEPRWAVPGLIAEGVTLLAGPPKIGKSWLSLGLGLAVASGGKALGRIPVDPGPVLYLALEDTPKRLQRRMSAILTDGPAPDGLHLAISCPPLPEGGDTHIARWIDRNPGARLVVIDVFTKVRGQQAHGSQYEADYAAIGRAKALADTHGIACVLVHHVRKAGSDDFLTEISGTNGLAGAADAVMVLKRARGQADSVLHITGRDVDENEYALHFQPDRGAWQLLDGPTTEHLLADTRATILRHVRTNPGSKPKQIALATGTDYELTRQTCRRMVADGQLLADTTGRYTTPPGADTSTGPGGLSPVTPVTAVTEPLYADADLGVGAGIPG